MKQPKYTEATKVDFCVAIGKHYGTDVVTTKQVSEFVKLNNLPYPYFLATDAKFKAGWGKYKLLPNFTAPTAPEVVEQPVQISTRKVAETVTQSFVPKVDENYVPFAFFNDLKNIIDSRIFYPVYITGLTGNGKTLMVEQVCAKLGREMIRVNITKETDETDLIGSYELIDGNTIRREGPVVVAMRRGAVLLLDETDYGSERLLCLQPILEGKGFFDKKTGEFIHPTTGFQIIATANTKGKGSDDGRYIGANILNEAFLERFAITVEQEYPSIATEKKILEKCFASLGLDDEEFIDALGTWAELIRKSNADGAVEDVISTRRLVHISRAYSIFKSRRKAIELCLNRFDTETKVAFMDFYSKIDKNIDKKYDDRSAAEKLAEKLEQERLAAEEARRQEEQRMQQEADRAREARELGERLAAEQAERERVRAAALAALGKPNATPTAFGNQSKPLTALQASQGYAYVAPGSHIFGDARNIANVSAKYMTPVKVTMNKTTGDAVIESHGYATTVKSTEYMLDGNGRLLGVIVDRHASGIFNVDVMSCQKEWR